MDKKNDDNPLNSMDDIPLDDLSSPPCIDENITIRVKCTGPSTPASDYTLTVSTVSMSVLKFKELVRKKIGPSANGRYLRLIVAGRLLAPDMAPLSNFKVNDGDVVHAVLAAPGVRGGQQAAMARGLTNRGSSRTRRVGGFNLRISDDSDDDGISDDDDDIEEGVTRMGFDRLRSTGLSRDEIAAIRLYFSRQVDRFAEQRRNRSNSTDDSDNSNSNENSGGDRDESEGGEGEDESPQSRRERRLRLEDEWMETQGPTSEFRMNLNTNAQNIMMFGGSNSLFFQQDGLGDGPMAAGRSFIGTDREFIWGFMLGFFIGFIMLYWIWMPTVSHKQKLGILCGISFQMALNLFKADGIDSVGEE